jgi:hypothetical protein
VLSGFFVKDVRIMTSRYKCVFFIVSLLFIAGAISLPWGHAGMRWDQDGMGGMDNMGAMGGKSIFNGIPMGTAIAAFVTAIEWVAGLEWNHSTSYRRMSLKSPIIFHAFIY